MKNESTAETQAVTVMRPVGPTGSGLMTMDSKTLKANLEAYSETRSVLMEWIKTQLVEGVDYGKAFEGTKKDTLLKPGAEKVCTLFNVTSHPDMDRETWEMLGKPTGTVCYIVKLMRGDSCIGVGRGAATVGEKKNFDANKAIKYAEKRAHVDATLRTFGLSEVFTQDLDDPDEREAGSTTQQPHQPRKPIVPPTQQGGNQQVKDSVNALYTEYETLWMQDEHCLVGEPIDVLMADKTVRGRVKPDFVAWSASILEIAPAQAEDIKTWTMDRVATCRTWLKQNGTQKRGN